MSRRYNMFVTVRNVDPKLCEQVKSAATQEWPEFDSWKHEESGDGTISLSASGEDNLCGGEGEEEFADRLAQAIWEAHRSYCCVEVVATYLDDLPCETHLRDAEAYEKWSGSKP